MILKIIIEIALVEILNILVNIIYKYNNNNYIIIIIIYINIVEIVHIFRQRF